MQSRTTILLRAPSFTNCLGNSPLLQENCRRYCGEMRWNDGTATQDGTVDPEPSPSTRAIYQEPRFFVFNTSIPLQSSILWIGIFASSLVASRFWSFLSDSWSTNSQEKDHSLPTSARYQRHPLCNKAVVSPVWKVALVGAHEPWAPLQCPSDSLTCPAILCWRAHASVFPTSESTSVRLSVLLWRSTLSSWSGTRGMVQRCSKWWYSDMNWLVP